MSEESLSEWSAVFTFVLSDCLPVVLSSKLCRLNDWTGLEEEKRKVEGSWGRKNLEYTLRGPSRETHSDL